MGIESNRGSHPEPKLEEESRAEKIRKGRERAELIRKEREKAERRRQGLDQIEENPRKE